MALRRNPQNQSNFGFFGKSKPLGKGGGHLLYAAIASIATAIFTFSLVQRQPKVIQASLVNNRASSDIDLEDQKDTFSPPNINAELGERGQLKPIALNSSDHAPTPKNLGNPVADRIPSGMRAMTVKVDATSAVEGWAASGSVVDVLLVAKDRTIVVAEAVTVLSSERSVSPINGQASPNVPTTATLLVTQQQCLAIATALPLGRIAFVLRNSTDEQAWNAESYTPERLGIGKEEAKVKKNVSGYAALSSDKSSKAFALADGKWIKTDSLPDSFYEKDKSRSNKRSLDQTDNTVSNLEPSNHNLKPNNHSDE